MHYEFPRDLTLDEVRDVVVAHNKALDVAAFIEADRVNHTIFNYVVAFDGSFPDVTSREAAILRECRGIVFAKDGRLLSRRFHKFFNVNQKAETQAHVIDWSRPHRILEKLDGCLPSFQTVDFCDGTKHPISKVVKEKMTGPVGGLDEDGNVVEAIITNWSQMDATRDWLTISIADPAVSVGKRTVCCTPNHRILTERGWLRADEVRVGDTVLRRTRVLTKLQRSVVLGSLLGDASICMNGGAPVLAFSTKAANSTYNDIKLSVLKPLTCHRRFQTGGYGTQQDRCIVRGVEPFKDIMNITYRDGAKFVTREWLSELDPLAIAVWYMDDGSLSRGNAKKQRPRAILHIEGFKEDEQLEICKYFMETWGLAPVLQKYRGYKCLRFNADDAVTFWEKIAYFVSRNMRYKLPAEYQDHPCFWDEFEPENRLQEVTEKLGVIGVDGGMTYKGVKNKSAASARWDIETTTGNFFTNKVLVHNSMITPLHLDGEVFWGTKMGLTDVALPVEEFVSRNPRYRDFALDEFAEGRTPIFEWCSLKQKIVIAYPEDRLILTAVRDNATGLYLSHDELLALGDRWGVPVVRALPGSVENIQTFLDEAYGLKGEEGYVIVFDDGHKVKVKAEEYCMIHNTKDTLQREKDVLAMIYSDKIDDLLPMMDPDDRVIVDRFMRDLEHEIAKTAAGLREIVEEARTRYPDKRSFATQFMPTWPNAMTKPFLFSIYDGIDPVEIVRRHVAKKVYSATQVEEARPLVGGLRWFDYYRTKFEGGD